MIYPNGLDENSSICASACARVKLLRGFWARGRVRGDRSVFVTSHRPVHLSRALMFSDWFELLHFRTGAVFLVCPPATPLHHLSLDLELFKVLPLEFEQVFCVNFTLRLLCSPGFRGERLSFNLLTTHCGYFRLLLFPRVQRTASITQLLLTHCGQCAALGCLR